MKTRVISGMRPTGSGNLHLGNYFGAMKQFIDLQDKDFDCFYFIADLHGLTEVIALTQIDELSVGVAKNYLACGVDPERSTLYRQSDVPEVSEISVLLGNITKISALRRCTTFKGKVEDLQAKRKGELGRDLTQDEADSLENSFSYGLLGYPVLMAADIFSVRAEVVPVGEDQVQNVEFARDFARQFNTMFDGSYLTVPKVNEVNPLRVPGVDGSGKKMGKSEGNTIDLLEGLPTIRKKVLGMRTQEEAGGAMSTGTEALYMLMQLCSPPDVHTSYLQRYAAREEKFFGEMKKRLAEDIVALTTPIQERFARLSSDDVRDILALGAKKVRPIAAAVLSDMRKAMGLKY